MNLRSSKGYADVARKLRALGVEIMDVHKFRGRLTESGRRAHIYILDGGPFAAWRVSSNRFEGSHASGIDGLWQAERLAAAHEERNSSTTFPQAMRKFDRKGPLRRLWVQTKWDKRKRKRRARR
jgi:hypothetical protein